MIYIRIYIYDHDVCHFYTVWFVPILGTCRVFFICGEVWWGTVIGNKEWCPSWPLRYTMQGVEPSITTHTSSFVRKMPTRLSCVWNHFLVSQCGQHHVVVEHISASQTSKWKIWTSSNHSSLIPRSMKQSYPSSVSDVSQGNGGTTSLGSSGLRIPTQWIAATCRNGLRSPLARRSCFGSSLFASIWRGPHFPRLQIQLNSFT